MTGTTELEVNNTTPGAGALNKQGIPVVYVNTPVASNAFQLKQPVRSGFYDYDLFFEPGPVNVFELRSAVGGGAFVVPQLPTGAQDIWYTTASSWFDRTADLRTALYGQGRGQASSRARISPRTRVPPMRALIRLIPGFGRGALSPA